MNSTVFFDEMVPHAHVETVLFDSNKWYCIFFGKWYCLMKKKWYCLQKNEWYRFVSQNSTILIQIVGIQKKLYIINIKYILTLCTYAASTKNRPYKGHTALLCYIYFIYIFIFINE